MFAQTDLIKEMPKLHRFANRLCRNRDEAEDLLQATLLRALEKKDQFDDGTNLFGWTSKIMYNQFVSTYRRRVRFESQYDPEDYISRQQVAPIPGSEFTLPCDLAIKALGFDPEDMPAMFGEPALAVTRWGTLKVNHRSFMTELDGVFAGGDIVRGASLVVWAIRDGRDAADQIEAYLRAKAQPLAQAAE